MLFNNIEIEGLVRLSWLNAEGSVRSTVLARSPYFYWKGLIVQREKSNFL